MSIPALPALSKRKAGKPHPTLPSSAFTPPNTSASDRFPLPASPNSVHPEHVIDANVISPSGDLSKWKSEISLAFGDKIGGVVLSLEGSEISSIDKTLSDISAADSQIRIVSILVPYALTDGAPTAPLSYLPSPTTSTSSQPPIVLSATYTSSSPKAIEALRWALANGYSVDLDVQANLRDKDSDWEAFEDFFSNVLPPNEAAPKGKVFLSNLLPPPDNVFVPIVKLLSHPTYQAYQAHMAALSLYSNVFIKFQPPKWEAPTPATPAPPGVNASSDSSLQKDTTERQEWKRRIKMYIGPALEAFGFQRIVYGSSPSPASHVNSNAGDWYELARESFAESGVEQEGIDAIFYSNAKLAYS